MTGFFEHTTVTRLDMNEIKTVRLSATETFVSRQSSPCLGVVELFGAGAFTPRDFSRAFSPSSRFILHLLRGLPLSPVLFLSTLFLLQTTTRHKAPLWQAVRRDKVRNHDNA